MDIERFMRNLNKKDDLLRRLNCDYKEGKAYRYFKCDFVKEIFYHQISEKDKYCYLRCRVTPSMRFSNAAYYVWALVEKDCNTPGRAIARVLIALVLQSCWDVAIVSLLCCFVLKQQSELVSQNHPAQAFFLNGTYQREAKLY